MSQLLHADSQIGDEILVDVQLSCVFQERQRFTGFYTCLAEIRDIGTGHAGIGYCVEVEFLGEHPLLMDPRLTMSIDGVVHEIENIDIGEGYHLVKYCPELGNHFFNEEPLKENINKRRYSTEEEALLDPSIAARVLLTGDGIHTRQRFYPLNKTT